MSTFQVALTGRFYTTRTMAEKFLRQYKDPERYTILQVPTGFLLIATRQLGPSDPKKRLQ